MGSQYGDLLNERAEILRDSEALYTAAAADGRELTAAERREDDTRLARLGRLNIEITEVEAERERMREAALNHPGGMPDAVRAGGRARSARFEDVFPRLGAHAGGFNSFSEFARVIRDGQHDPRMMAAIDLGIDQGGFLIPEQFERGILNGSLEAEIVRPRAAIHPMTADTKVIAGITHTDSSGGSSYGGLSGGWTAPGAQITAEQPAARSIRLTAHKLAVLAVLLNEVLADADVGVELERVMSEAFAWFLDTAFLRGSGAGMPLGVLNSPVTIEAAKDTGQTADTVTITNILNMLARLHPASHKNAVWLANPTCGPQLFTLTTGTDNLVLRQEGVRFFIYGIELIFTERASALGDRGDIMLCDFSQYAIGQRQGITLARSGELYFDYDKTAFRALARMDGVPTWAAPYTPLHGSTVSPFVVLAERA